MTTIVDLMCAAHTELDSIAFILQYKDKAVLVQLVLRDSYCPTDAN